MKHVTLLLILLLLPSGAAFGVSPARQTFDEPGTHDFVLRVIDAEGEFDARIDGPYAEQFTITTTDDEVRGTVTVPPVADTGIPPGDHEHKVIVALQDATDGVIAATVELAGIVTLRKRYDGPYLTADVHASPNEGVRDSTAVYVTLENIGSAPVLPTEMLVSTMDNEFLLEPREITVGSAESFTTIITGSGVHDALLTVRGEAPLEHPFQIVIGTPVIEEFTAIPVVEAGEITPIDVRVTLQWNAPVPVRIFIGDQLNEVTVRDAYEERFYVEGNQTVVALEIGQQREEIELSWDREAIREERQDWVLPLLLIITILAAVLFVLWQIRE